MKVDAMTDAELERCGRRAWGRASNPLRTHGSHVRSAETFRQARDERDRRDRAQAADRDRGAER